MMFANGSRKICRMIGTVDSCYFQSGANDPAAERIVK